jgi:uncharacterized protein
MILPILFVAPVQGKGRAVFTMEDLPDSTIIEISPVIVMDKNQRILLDQTLLHDYIFEWGHKRDKCCMALGYLPLYNHSYQANCEYEMEFDEDMIRVRTVRLIKKGEELTINYNGDWNDPKKVWFDARD